MEDQTLSVPRWRRAAPLRSQQQTHGTWQAKPTATLPRASIQPEVNFAHGNGHSGGFDDLPPATCESLLGGQGEAMNVDKENTENDADASRPGAATQRDLRTVMGTCNSCDQAEDKDFSEALPVQDAGPKAPELRAALLSDEEALARLERVAISGTGPPGLLGGPIDGLEATHAVIKSVCVASHNPFEQRKAEVRWVTETAQLDRYEAIAYVLAEVLGAGELLLEEARPIGKRALERIEGKSGVKARAEKIKQKAKTAHSNATSKAKKDEALAAALAETIEKINEARDREIDALMHEVYSGLGLPEAGTVIRERRPPTAAEVDDSAARKLRRLRKAAMEAAEEVKIADAHRVAARRERESAHSAPRRHGALGMVRRPRVW